MPMSSLTEISIKKDLLTQASQLLEQGSHVAIRSFIHSLYPAEIAHILESLRMPQRTIIWRVIPPTMMGEILIKTHTEVGQRLFEITDKKDVIQAMKHLKTDDVADLLHILPRSLLSEAIQSLKTHERNKLESTLAYDSHTVGGLMSSEVLAIRADVTLAVVIRFLRQKTMPTATDSLIVVDRDGKVQGVLSLSNLLSHHPNTIVATAMNAKMQGVSYQMSAADVAIMFEQRQMLSSPVVKEDGRLIGRITIDDVVGIIREEAEHSMMRMAGLDEEQDMFAPIFSSAERRTVWLGVNLMTAFLASWMIGLFEATLEQIVTLAILMPIVASMGGIAGIQTLTLVVRGLALRQINTANAMQLLRKEVAVGIVNGITWAFIVAIIVSVLFNSTQLGVLLGIALVINLICASLAGVGIPLFLDKLGIDPALAGGVLLTTVTDCVGFVAFLGLAAVFLL